MLGPRSILPSPDRARYLDRHDPVDSAWPSPTGVKPAVRPRSFDPQTPIRRVESRTQAGPATVSAEGAWTYVKSFWSLVRGSRCRYGRHQPLCARFLRPIDGASAYGFDTTNWPLRCWFRSLTSAQESTDNLQFSRRRIGDRVGLGLWSEAGYKLLPNAESYPIITT